MKRNGRMSPLPNAFASPPAWSVCTSRGRRGLSSRTNSRTAAVTAAQDMRRGSVPPPRGGGGGGASPGRHELGESGGADVAAGDDDADARSAGVGDVPGEERRGGARTARFGDEL